MEDLLNAYFEVNFTEEQKALIYRGLGICNVYNYPAAFQEIETLIMSHQEMHSENIRDACLDQIEIAMDNIIMASRITLDSEPSLRFKIELLEAIFAIPYRECYSGYAGIMEDPVRTDVEKLGYVVCDISNIDIATFLEHVEWIYEGSFERLKSLILERAKEEEKVGDVELLKSIRKNLIIFEQAFGLPKALEGLQSIEFAKGCPFDLYYELFHEEIIGNDLESATWCLIYLAVVSSDGYLNPQKLLLDKADQIFDSVQKTKSFTNMLNKAMGRYQEFKEHLK